MNRVVLVGVAVFVAVLGLALVGSSSQAKAGLFNRGCGGYKCHGDCGGGKTFCNGGGCFGSKRCTGRTRCTGRCHGHSRCHGRTRCHGHSHCTGGKSYCSGGGCFGSKHCSGRRLGRRCHGRCSGGCGGYGK